MNRKQLEFTRINVRQKVRLVNNARQQNRIDAYKQISFFYFYWTRHWYSIVPIAWNNMSVKLLSTHRYLLKEIYTRTSFILASYCLLFLLFYRTAFDNIRSIYSIYFTLKVNKWIKGKISFVNLLEKTEWRQSELSKKSLGSELTVKCLTFVACKLFATNCWLHFLCATTRSYKHPAIYLLLGKLTNSFSLAKIWSTGIGNALHFCFGT